LTDPVPFGRYQLINLLGKGGMARVYRGVLSGPMGFEKQVALKLIDKDYTADAKFLQALTNEARLGGQIHHRNVVEIYEFNSVDDNWYMAMEYVDGWTLDFVLDECRKRGQYLPPTVVVDLMVEICAGLDYAHDLKTKEGQPLNLVHRDLKPGNIILGRSGDVKIMDFGIAKAESNLYKTTAADVVKGTPVYMSPEQVNAEPLDRRSDLFSLGSVLHELITLQVPFQGNSLGAVVAGILKTDLTLPLQRIAERAASFAPLVTGLLAQKPDDRPDDAGVVRDRLETMRRELPAGPSLRSWLEIVEPHLPAARPAGDFGNDGPPAAVTLDPAGQSYSSSGPLKPPETVLLEPGPTRPDAVGRRRRRKKKKASPLPWIAGGVVALAAIGLAIFWILQVSGGATETVEATPTPSPTATSEPATPEPTPSAVAEVTPTAAPTPKATPRLVAATPAPTPKPTPEPSPAAVTTTGTANLNSDRWSYVSVDGRTLPGTTPHLGIELPVGSHVAVFSCTACEPPEEATKHFEVREGELTKVVHRFGH